jgi:hypothetical protein
MKFPVIDYSKHPAYSGLVTAQIYDEDFISDAVRRVDTLYSGFTGIASPTMRESEEALTGISAILEEIKSHMRAAKAPLLAFEWVAQMSEYCMTQWRYEFVRRVFSAERYRSTGLGKLGEGQLASIQTKGMYEVELNGDDYEVIRVQSLKFLPMLREQLGRQPLERSVQAVEGRAHTLLARAIESAMQRAGVFDVLSEFKKNKMGIMGTGLEYSRAGQVWYRGLYSDFGLPDSPFKYLHVDEADHLPKAMIYATSVSEETGPTHVVPESNCWDRSEFLFTMHKGLDRITMDRYGKHYLGPRYRLISRDSDLRRVFMSLPKAFQGSSHMGDDILPGSEWAKELASREIKFVSENRQKSMVFNGCRVLHRGSVVQSGERLALQVIFSNVNSAKIDTQMLGGLWPGRIKPVLRALYANFR